MQSRRGFLRILSGAAGLVGCGADSVAPGDKTIALFDGKSLDGWYSWLATTQYDDPKKVFSVVDGMLRVSGEVPGYLGTKQEYRDYHLVAEYKWGDLTYGAKTVRNS